MNTNQARQDIGRRLSSVRSSIRRAQWQRGGLQVATVTLAGLLLMMAADHFLAPLPPLARWAMFGLWVVATCAAAVVGLKPLLRKINLVQVARWIEGRHPEIEERMSTVLEISGGDAGVSQELLGELERAAGLDVDKVDARAEIKAVGAGRRWARPALMLALLLLLLFVVWPKEAARLAVRAVAPFSTLGNAAAVKFEVLPGDIELLEGDAIHIDVAYDGPAKAMELVMELAGGSEVIQPMLPSGDQWTYRMEPVREGFTYHARAGRGESDAFKVTVWPLPSVVEPRVALKFPDYTGLLPAEEPLGRGVEAVRGTTVELRGDLNTAVDAAWLEIDGKRVADGEIENSAAGGRLGISWTLGKESSGEAVVRLKHRLGREIDALRFPVRVLDDLSPAVRWLSPIARELRVRPDEVLGLRYEVTEDFGVAALQLEVKAGGKEAERLPRDLPEKLGGGTKPARYRGASEVAVGELLERWPNAGEMRLRVRAADARPAELDGPGVGHSEWLLVRIDRNAESLARQEMRAEHEEARQTIEQAIQATREARERMDRHRHELEREVLSKDAVKGFEEARDKLAATKEKLEELAQRMEESVHATKADEVREASEQVAQARQELENAPLQDGKEQREAKLDAGRDHAEAAVKKLEEVRNEMDRDRQKIEELTRFQELAQQQRELARQAEQQATARQEVPLPEDWQQRQQAMEEALRQQLREQPQARAEVLEEQAKEAKALAEQARELSEAQKGLEEQVRQTPANVPEPPTAPEALREALAKEQAKIAEETAEQLAEARQDRSAAADILPEAAAATKEASEQMAKREDKAAAESAREAVEALKESVSPSEQGGPIESKPEQGQPEQGQPEQGQPERAAAVEALAERQEQVAEAMEALAAGKTGEARQALQQMQAEAARQLAEAVAEMPQAEGSGHMNEAKDASKQGGEQAKAAAESSGQSKPQDAAGQHQQSAESLQRGADALGRASEDFARQAEQARGQQAEQHRAPISPGDLAEAFQAASQAAGEPKTPQAASQASQAAEAMSRAAQAARQQMQGRGQPGQPGPPAPPGGAPGQKPEEQIQTPGADPGLPPELAKLGISAADWEKIQATLKSDVGGGGGAGMPEEYRGLVKKYFEAMTDE